MSAADGKERALHILLIGIITASGIGFLVGTRPASPDDAAPTHVSAHEDSNRQSSLTAAPSYTDQRETVPASANAEWRSDLSALHAALPGLGSGDGPSEQEQADANRERLQNRAYDGAPPTIPHPIQSQGAPECLACHGEGLAVDDRTAQRPSHPYLTSCTQCHVEGTARFGGRPSEGVLAHTQNLGGQNAFGGHAWPRLGDRAWEGAPPTIPHPTWMRQECNSCHGPSGRNGLRTPHTDRQSCTQCHAPGAVLDQRPLPFGAR